MAYWLMKSEPNAYSIVDLKRDKKIYWDGVRNYQARNFMRSMQVGDQAFFYHSNCKVPGIAGMIKIVKMAYPDHTAFDPDDPHYDPKSKADNPRWEMVDVAFVRAFPEVVSLAQLRETASLEKMQILRKGNRLSITPVTPEEWDIILKLAK